MEDVTRKRRGKHSRSVGALHSGSVGRGKGIKIVHDSAVVDDFLDVSVTGEDGEGFRHSRSVGALHSGSVGRGVENLFDLL